MHSKFSRCPRVIFQWAISPFYGQGFPAFFQLPLLTSFRFGDGSDSVPSISRGVLPPIQVLPVDIASAVVTPAHGTISTQFTITANLTNNTPIQQPITLTLIDNDNFVSSGFKQTKYQLNPFESKEFVPVPLV